MVEPKPKKIFYFTVFILPCLILYLMFFIRPFFNGIGISLTNWDGLTPKTPISMEKSEFESKILNNIKNDADKDYVLKIYSVDPSDSCYKRIAVGGLTRRKLEHIVKKAGYEPDLNKFVGLDNYKAVFTGKVKKDFYPHFYDQIKYNKNSELPLAIHKKDMDKEILPNCKDAAAGDLIRKAYAEYDAENDQYRLSADYDDFELTNPLYDLAELSDKTVSESELDDFIRKAQSAALSADTAALQDIESGFISTHKLSAGSSQVVRTAAAGLLRAAELKNVLSTTWVLKKFSMGVVGFTLFFAIFSVVGINVVAFALALALDSGVYGQKVMRTVFFLPNVLSMVIVALIWSLLFNQLLPSLTGIKEWIGDPAKTPWLLVAVAVWQGCGYYMIVYLAGLQNIPTDVIEASKIDGAGALQRFRFITLPLMVPSITISLFLSIANALKSFDLMYAMIGPTGYATGTVPFVYDIYFDAFSNKQAGMATAKAMVLFIAIFIITGMQLYIMKRKEVEQ